MQMTKYSFPAIALMALLLVGSTAISVTGQPSETYTWRNVAIIGGGFVPGIIYNEGEPALVYARTDIGGAYRLDNGATFTEGDDISISANASDADGSVTRVEF